jgi:group I intron endonuclease
MYIIYLITNLVNGKVYVGQTNQPIERRWALHKSRSRKNEGYTAHLYNAMRKYGIDAFEIKPMATCETLEWSNYLERVWVLLLNSTDPAVGYNMTSGGDKRSPVPAAIEKTRQKNLGRKRTPEARKKVSEGLREAWSSGRFTGNRGQKLSSKTREKMSKNRTGRGHPSYNHDICSEELLFLLNNGAGVLNIAQYFGISESTVLRRVKSTELPCLGPNEIRRQEEETVSRLLSEGRSPKEISEIMGRCIDTVRSRIKALGLTRNN